jgi:hypothetical protein
MDRYKIVNQNSCQGLQSDATSKVKLYQWVHKKYCVFASTQDLNTDKQPKVLKLWLVVEWDMNRFLVQQFIDFYVSNQ